MINIFLTVISLSVLLLILTIIIFIFFLMNWLKKKLIFDHYVEVLSILEEAKQLSYEKLYQDEIIVHAASGYRTNMQDIRSLQSSFVRIVISLIGPNVMEDLKIIYGDEECIFSHLVTFFNNKVTEDEATIFNKNINDTFSEEENE